MTKPYSVCLKEWLGIQKPADKDDYCLEWFSHLIKCNDYGSTYTEYENLEYKLIYSSLINEIVAMNRYRRL